MRNQNSSGVMRTTTASPTRRILPRWLSPERLTLALTFALLTLLEVVPIQAALLTLAGATQSSLAETFGPLWLIVATLLLFALARWWLGSRHPAWLALASLLISAIVIASFVALSPTAYGAMPGGLFSSHWLDQLQVDAIIDAPRFNGLFIIVPCVAYLGWRGLTLGAPTPRIETTLRRFTISLAVVMFACIAALAVPAALQPSLQGALLTLLAVEVFAGLAAAALSRRGGGRESTDADAGAETMRWLLTAFGAAALVIAVSFGIGLALNFSLLSSALGGLGPVGVAVNSALAWLVNGLAYLLWITFVKTIGAWLFQNAAFYITPPATVSSTPSQHPHHSVLAPPPMGLVVAAGVIVGLVILGVVVIAVYVVVRTLLRTLLASAEPEMDEEREALDAAGLLRRQARDLLAGLRRRSGAAERDPLTPGTARWHFRETLRAGAAAGVVRRAGETADEYSQRLALTLQARGAPSEDAALTALTRAYDDARYGERPADATEAEVATASRRLTAALNRMRG
jgi:hypothetical protein